MSKIKEIRERLVLGGSIPLGMSIVQHEHLMLQATRDDVATLLEVLDGVRAAATNPDYGWVDAGVEIERILNDFDHAWLHGEADADA